MEGAIATIACLAVCSATIAAMSPRVGLRTTVSAIYRGGATGTLVPIMRAKIQRLGMEGPHETTDMKSVTRCCTCPKALRDTEHMLRNSVPIEKRTFWIGRGADLESGIDSDPGEQSSDDEGTLVEPTAGTASTSPRRRAYAFVSLFDDETDQGPCTEISLVCRDPRFERVSGATRLLLQYALCVILEEHAGRENHTVHLVRENDTSLAFYKSVGFINVGDGGDVMELDAEKFEQVTRSEHAAAIDTHTGEQNPRKRGRTA